jgi:hypothetical protein
MKPCAVNLGSTYNQHRHAGAGGRGASVVMETYGDAKARGVLWSVTIIVASAARAHSSSAASAEAAGGAFET